MTKKKPKSEHLPNGRPSKMTPETLAKLRSAFAVGATDAQACFYAGIDESTFYRYCDKNPDFRNETERLKENPVLKAKTNIVQEIQNGNIDVAKWYLERRARQEFATRRELGNSDGVPFELTITDYGEIDPDQETA